MEDDGYYYPNDVSTRNSGDDYPSDDNGPDPQFGPVPSYDTIEYEYPTDNIGAEIRNEAQNNRKNEDEESQDEVGDSESITKDGNNQSETEKRYNIRK